MTGVLLRRGKCGHRDIQRGEHGRMEAESGVMLPQAKENLGPPEAGGGKEEPPLEVSEGPGPAETLTLGLWLPAL